MLQFASDGQVHTVAEARQALAAHFTLTDAERGEMLSSGRQRRFDNRVAWGKVYLERGGLLESPKRAHFVITERGREVLSREISRIDIGFLTQFEGFGEFRKAVACPS